MALTIACFVTVIVTDALPVSPSLSVTVNVTVYVPAEENVWLGFGSLETEPSPKFHA